MNKSGGKETDWEWDSSQDPFLYFLNCVNMSPNISDFNKYLL